MNTKDRKVGKIYGQELFVKVSDDKDGELIFEYIKKYFDDMVMPKEKEEIL